MQSHISKLFAKYFQYKCIYFQINQKYNQNSYTLSTICEFSGRMDEFSGNCKIPGGSAVRTDFNGIYIGWVETLAGCCPAH
jgi:hypothetical protein